VIVFPVKVFTKICMMAFCKTYHHQLKNLDMKQQKTKNCQKKNVLQHTNLNLANCSSRIHYQVTIIPNTRRDRKTYHNITFYYGTGSAVSVIHIHWLQVVVNCLHNFS